MSYKIVQPIQVNGRFYTRDALYIRLDELGQAFIVRLVMPPQYKDGHKTHYASRRTMFDCSSYETHNR